MSFDNDDVTKRWNERTKFEKGSPTVRPLIKSKGRFVGASLMLAGFLGISLGIVLLFEQDKSGTKTDEVVKAPEEEVPRFDPASLAGRTPDGLYDLAGKFARNGDTQHALVVWEEAAQRRHGQSARAIGEMYDPRLWGKVPTAMTSPNVDFARKWYGRAVEYGDGLARSRLADLADWEETSAPR